MRRFAAALSGVVACACASGHSTIGVVPQPEVRLEAQVAALRADLDAARLENDSLRAHAALLDSALVSAELRLRVVSLELQRLKEIDFRPRAARVP